MVEYSDHLVMMPCQEVIGSHSFEAR
jgi:hypothetical protein